MPNVMFNKPSMLAAGVQINESTTSRSEFGKYKRK
jgi:hypothetical protein